MVVEISQEAQTVLDDVYADFPELTSDADMQLVTDLLYHVSHNVSFRIEMCEGQLVLTTINRKSRPWDK